MVWSVIGWGEGREACQGQFLWVLAGMAGHEPWAGALRGNGEAPTEGAEEMSDCMAYAFVKRHLRTAFRDY